MRNLARYPLVANEAISHLVEIETENKDTDIAPGDMRLYVLSRLIQFLDNNKEEFNKFCASEFAEVK